VSAWYVRNNSFVRRILVKLLFLSWSFEFLGEVGRVRVISRPVGVFPLLAEMGFFLNKNFKWVGF
jgi:hypothetical protein